jgi:hypothetical protein
MHANKKPTYLIVLGCRMDFKGIVLEFQSVGGVRGCNLLFKVFFCLLFFLKHMFEAKDNDLNGLKAIALI